MPNTVPPPSRSAPLAADGEAARPLRVGDVELDPGRRLVRRTGEPVPLTRREFDLLRALLVRAGRCVTRASLMDEVWGTWYGSTKTLDVHVSSLRRKLGDDPAAARYVHTLRG